MTKKLHMVAAVAALALTLAGCVARENASDETSGDDFTPSATETAESESDSGTSTDGDCQYTADSAEEPAVGLPPDEGPVDATSVTLATSAGPMTIQFDAERAPCTVASIAFLAGKGFYNGTSCHRMTASEGLKVLQCGDPLGTGSGGPGYTIPDELPTDLPAGPASTDGTETSIYQRGIVAMANAGPDTGGSQFFLVYGDSTLPPNYTVFGTLDAAGLATLDQIAAGGITEGANGPQDGAPATPVTIESATVA